MKKLVYVVSNLTHSAGFEWLAEGLNREKFNVEFIFLNPEEGPLQEKIRSLGIPLKTFPFHGKKDLPGTIMKLYSYLRKAGPDIVHAHLFEASLAAMIASRLAGVKKRIHTRHHASLHHVYHKQAVKYDRLINMLSTDIVAVSGVVADILVQKEGVSRKKVRVIHHGFRLEQFAKEQVQEARVVALRNKYAISEGRPVIGVISRYTGWKGIQFIIPAFRQLLGEFPDAMLFLANAKGDYAAEIKTMLSSLPADSYRETGFEKDIFALYRLFDLFVHVPVTLDAEAFGQIYIEAMAASQCMVCTLSGIGPEVVTDGRNAVVVPYRDAESIHRAMKDLLTDPSRANELRTRARNDVNGRFTVKEMTDRLEVLYGE